MSRAPAAADVTVLKTPPAADVNFEASAPPAEIPVVDDG